MFRTYSETLGHLTGTVILELLNDFVVLTQFNPLFTSVKTYISVTSGGKQNAPRFRRPRKGGDGKTLTGFRWSETYETTGSACFYWNSYICWNNSSCAKAYCHARGGRSAAVVKTSAARACVFLTKRTSRTLSRTMGYEKKKTDRNWINF